MIVKWTRQAFFKWQLRQLQFYRFIYKRTNEIYTYLQYHFHIHSRSHPILIYLSVIKNRTYEIMKKLILMYIKTLLTNKRYTGINWFYFNLIYCYHILHENVFSTVLHISMPPYSFPWDQVTWSLISTTVHLHWCRRVELNFLLYIHRVILSEL